MADQITNYKCPACSGPLHFAAKSGKMECEFCGSSYSVEEIEATYAEADAKAAQAKAEALYDTGVNAVYGDEILVLTTCSHHTTDGRFAVIAKGIK